MKKKVALGMMLMLVLLSVGGCYVGIGGDGGSRAHHDQAPNYHGYDNKYHEDGGSHTDRDYDKGGSHDSNKGESHDRD
jgi:hypothetical protein